jgi:hypothetical protein
MNRVKNPAEEKNRPLIILGIFIAVVVAMIAVSYQVLQIPIVAVCSMVILEALLCALLDRIPLWVHGLFIIAQIVGGILLDKLVFMILMCVVYVAAVALLYLWTSKKA